MSISKNQSQVENSVFLLVKIQILIISTNWHSKGKIFLILALHYWKNMISIWLTEYFTCVWSWSFWACLVFSDFSSFCKMCSLIRPTSLKNMKKMLLLLSRKIPLNVYFLFDIFTLLYSVVHQWSMMEQPETCWKPPENPPACSFRQASGFYYLIHFLKEF